jgi:hypothetical protein
MCQRNSCRVQEEIRTGGLWGATVGFIARRADFLPNCTIVPKLRYEGNN